MPSTNPVEQQSDDLIVRKDWGTREQQQLNILEGNKKKAQKAPNPTLSVARQK